MNHEQVALTGAFKYVATIEWKVHRAGTPEGQFEVIAPETEFERGVLGADEMANLAANRKEE